MEEQTPSENPEQAIIRNTIRRLIKILPFLAVALFLGVGGTSGYYYYFKVRPLQILQNAIPKTLAQPAFNAIRIEFDSNRRDNNLDVEIAHQLKPEQLTRVSFALDNIQGITQNNVKGGFVIHNGAVYLQVFHVDSYKFAEPFNQYFPEILPSKTYVLAYPVLTGSQYLQMGLPLVQAIVSRVIPPTLQELVRGQNINQMFNILAQALVARGYKSNLSCGDSSCDKISLGLDKDKLNYGADFPLAAIFINAVAERGVIEVLVDRQMEIIREVSLTIPPLSKSETLQLLRLMGSEDTTKETGYLLEVIRSYVEKLPDWGISAPNMTLNIKQYQQEPVIELPQNFVEFNKIKEAFIEEKWLPYFINHPQLQSWPLVNQLLSIL